MESALIEFPVLHNIGDECFFITSQGGFFWTIRIAALVTTIPALLEWSIGLKEATVLVCCALGGAVSVQTLVQAMARKLPALELLAYG